MLTSKGDICQRQITSPKRSGKARKNSGKSGKRPKCQNAYTKIQTDNRHNTHGVMISPCSSSPWRWWKAHAAFRGCRCERRHLWYDRRDDQEDEPPPRRREVEEAPPQGERVSAPQTRGRGCDKRRARKGERIISGAPARRGAVGRVAVATTGSPQAAGWPRSERECSGPEDEQRATAPAGRGQSGFAGNEVPAAAHARGRTSGEPLRGGQQVASMRTRERGRGAEPR